MRGCSRRASASPRSRHRHGRRPLACYLHDRAGVPGAQLLIEQGYLMRPASPSLITVDLDLDGEGRIQRLMAGGNAQVVRTLSLAI